MATVAGPSVFVLRLRGKLVAALALPNPANSPTLRRPSPGTFRESKTSSCLLLPPKAETTVPDPASVSLQPLVVLQAQLVGTTSLNADRSVRRLLHRRKIKINHKAPISP